MLEELMKILKEEYDIETPAELDKAILALGRIDITAMCEESRKYIKESA